MRAGIAFVLMYLASDRLAASLGSTRGEAGLVVCAAVVALTVLADRWLTRAPLRSCAPVALLALAMAISWSFPLAWLFDRADGSIWPGALLHAVIQGGVKVLVDDDPAFQTLAIAWVALGLAAPWLFFLLTPAVNVRVATSDLRRP